MTTKKLKVSRNRKKTWKKHCQATDVEEFLEENRFNERIGGSAVEKSDDNLFFIEKIGEQKTKKVDKTEEVGTKTRSKLKELSSGLKCFKALELQSKVPAVGARVGPKNTKRNFLNDDQKFAKLWPQKRKQYLKAKEEEEYKKRVNEDPNLRFQTYDLWDDKPKSEEVDPEIEELKDYQEILKGSKPPKVPRYRYQKPSLLPSVELPHSGQSYNPDFEDHQNLLAVAHDIEVDKMKREKRMKRLVEEYYVTKTQAPNDKTWAQEMSHGLGLSEDEEEVIEENKEEEEDVTTSKLIRPDKTKTRAQRRKELLRKKLEEQKRLEKLKKEKDNEVFKIKTIKKEIERKEKESLERQKRKSKRIIEKLYKPKRISRYEYEAPDVELHLSEELSGSLRALKTEGNLLEDRFKSLQRRNIIESRTKQTFKRKYKLKKFDKKTCKEPIEATVR